MPLISRDVPAYASSGQAFDANDSNYDSYWRSSGALPAWIAYDLSAVPAVQRGRVAVVWYCDSWNWDYISSADRYNLPALYTIDAHAAHGGAAPPAPDDAGWVKLAEVATVNPYNSRQHIVNLTSGTTVYNWIRMRVTQASGVPWNFDAMFNLDVHDAHLGVDDDWIFFGDSITAGGMKHYDQTIGPTFSEVVHTAYPDYFPLQQDGGVGGWTAADGIAHLPAFLADFPGRYVGLAFGTNDTWGFTPQQFYNNYETMVQAVIAAGKIPAIPKIPWNPQSFASKIPALNDQLERLKSAYPQIVSGPDLWTFFQSNPSLISSDNLHPNDAGYIAYRRQWAEAMISNVYAKAAPPAVNSGGILNAASFSATVAPGGLASLFGQGLADGVYADLFDSAKNAFATTVAGVSVSVGGELAPLTYVSPGQINFQVPWATPAGSAAVPVQVIRHGVASNSEMVTFSPTAPSVFAANGAAILTCAVSVCTLWGNGFGPTTAVPEDGAPAAGVAWATHTCTLSIGGQEATVTYCGAAPGLVIDQLNFVYPAAAVGTDAALTINGVRGAFRLPAL